MNMMVEIQKKNSRRSDRFLGTVFLFMVWIVPPAGLFSQDVIPFRSERWTFDGADTLEYLGRAALAGNVLLKDAGFTDGIIEVDLAVNGATSYPGVVFRQESPGNYERVYLRPHRSGLYPDAVQYVAAFNGLDSWQFYNGDGLSAPSAKLPVNEWFRLKIEVKGTQARVFIGDSEDPVFLIHNLKRGKSSGTIGLMGPRNRSAYFSNFRYREDHTLVFDPPPRSDIPPPGSLQTGRSPSP